MEEEVEKSLHIYEKFPKCYIIYKLVQTDII